MSPGSDLKPFEVVGGKQLIRQSAQGGVENYYQVKIRTARGMVLNVDISEADWNAKKADGILTAAAKNADEILSL